MSFSPGGRLTTVTITPYHPLSCGPDLIASNVGVGASAVWPAANRAIYIPIYLPAFATVTKFFWLNGATVGNGGASIGLYAQDGTLIVRDGTGQTTSGASALQFYDPTDTFVSPGTYYLALSLQSASDTINRTAPAVASVQGMGFAQEASAYPLPATATPAQTANAYVPYCGVTFRTIASSP